MEQLPRHRVVAVPRQAADHMAVVEGTANRLEEMVMEEVATDRVATTQAVMDPETILGLTLLESARAEEKGSEERADGRRRTTPRQATGLVAMTTTIMSRQGAEVADWIRT